MNQKIKSFQEFLTEGISNSNHKYDAFKKRWIELPSYYGDLEVKKPISFKMYAFPNGNGVYIELYYNNSLAGFFHSLLDPEEGCLNDIEVFKEFQGLGFGKILTLKMIDVFEGFEIDNRGLTKEQTFVYDSLIKSQAIEVYLSKVTLNYDKAQEIIDSTINKLTPPENSLYEVRYINTKFPSILQEEPLRDDETIRVFHGFNNFDDATTVVTKGLSGKEKARRIYSYEMGNNPIGLFVTVDFKIAEKFNHSGVIIEFSTKVSDLEAPVWVGGRSYFIQGEYTKSFKDLDEREKQRLINRELASQSKFLPISKSDRPELAESIFDNPERQALFVGDLNPNMIKAVWYNEKWHKEGKTDGKWERMKPKDFIRLLGIERENKFIKYLPTDDFNFDEFVQQYFEGDFVYVLKDLRFPERFSEYDLKNLGFFPKQIQQIMDLKNGGFFEKYEENIKIPNI